MTKNRQGFEQLFSLMHLSIGVVNTELSPIDHYTQLAMIASEVKSRAKLHNHPGRSGCVWNGRTEGSMEPAS
jgi:hypothetical protein